jgi:hypothetical protein
MASRGAHFAATKACRAGGENDDPPAEEKRAAWCHKKLGVRRSVPAAGTRATATRPYEGGRTIAVLAMRLVLEQGTVQMENPRRITRGIAARLRGPAEREKDGERCLLGPRGAEGRDQEL